MHGLIFVCLADKAPDFESARRAIEPHIRPHGLERAKVCHMEEYTIRANWKVVFENNRECYHCPIGHPEFCRSNYDLGMPGDGRSNANYGTSLTATTGLLAFAGLGDGGCQLSQRRVVRGPHAASRRIPHRKPGWSTGPAPLMGDLKARGRQSLRVITLPNAWFHADSDYANSTQLIPSGLALTRARIIWFVHEAARPRRGLYDPSEWLPCGRSPASRTGNCARTTRRAFNRVVINLALSLP